MNGLKNCCLITVFLCIPCFGLAADWGDAPDGGPTGYPGLFAQTGQFPTLPASGGANAVDTSQATLGPASSDEAGPVDPADPDGAPNLGPVNTDVDDGIVDFVLLLTAIPPPASMAVNVSAPAGSAGGLFFINTLIDLNMDGKWGGVVGPGLPEWAVRNFPVVVTPGMDMDIRLPAFQFGMGNRLPDGAWMRITLTREFIPAGDWDGSGTFTAGDIEDHVIELPDKCTALRMNCPGPVDMTGVATKNFICNVSNMCPNPIDIRTLLREVTPGVNVTRVALPAGGCTSNGPKTVRCTELAVAPAPPPLVITYTATKTGKLPARWTYRGWSLDPPAIISSSGVTVGYGDSVGDVDFIESPSKQQKVQLDDRRIDESGDPGGENE